MNILRHLAIIMDGNGRWAKIRGKVRTEGHKVGAETVRDITTYCAKQETIETLTLYAFSTENWKRPKMEVNFLMRLLDNYLRNELSTYMELDTRFETIGDLSPFSNSLKQTISETKELTKNNKSLVQVLALNYGSRDEIVRAANRVIAKDQELTEESLTASLDSSYGDIDLIVRTSGEQRLSNFLLWQLSYSEIFFTDTLWPDFTASELEEIIENFQQRNRKYGGI
ncbi:MAG: di-trans,poly-cis-decaprenylcistransferase [Sulfurovum sp.]|nr:di-trans,poly-cis-decaprenylcistransferase [Sulfurovum sp.]